ncbi:hypothetical protein P9112_010120 [Eukaryota sp. TZLM1-RC]
MKVDLISHIAECILCQKTVPIPKNNIPATGSPNSVKRPFEYLHCDTIGSLSTGSYGNKYILHFVDAFSKLSILIPVADITALTVRAIIKRRLLLIHPFLFMYCARKATVITGVSKESVLPLNPA